MRAGLAGTGTPVAISALCQEMGRNYFTAGKWRQGRELPRNADAEFISIKRGRPSPEASGRTFFFQAGDSASGKDGSAA